MITKNVNDGHVPNVVILEPPNVETTYIANIGASLVSSVSDVHHAGLLMNACPLVDNIVSFIRNRAIEKLQCVRYVTPEKCQCGAQTARIRRVAFVLIWSKCNVRNAKKRSWYRLHRTRLQTR